MSAVSASRPHPELRRQAMLAFALGLLGIPGCTVAWSLPAGGFWIGVPLAVAAIWLGRRARAAGGLAVAAMVLGALELGFMATWTIVSAVG